MCELDFDSLLAPIINPIDHKEVQGTYVLETPELFSDALYQLHASLAS